jgi:hypothetical protein
MRNVLSAGSQEHELYAPEIVIRDRQDVEPYPEEWTFAYQHWGEDSFPWR